MSTAVLSISRQQSHFGSCPATLPFQPLRLLSLGTFSSFGSHHSTTLESVRQPALLQVSCSFKCVQIAFQTMATASLPLQKDTIAVTIHTYYIAIDKIKPSTNPISVSFSMYPKLPIHRQQERILGQL